MFKILLAIALSGSADFQPWASFGKGAGFDGIDYQVDIATIGGGGMFADRPVWNYSFRRTKTAGKRKTTYWTDTLRCPAARSLLKKLVNVSPPRPWAPGIANPFIKGEEKITLDGSFYELKVPTHYDGTMFGETSSFTSNAGTPLANWIDESLKTLEPCWDAKRPPPSF